MLRLMINRTQGNLCCNRHLPSIRAENCSQNKISNASMIVMARIENKGFAVT